MVADRCALSRGGGEPARRGPPLPGGERWWSWVTPDVGGMVLGTAAAAPLADGGHGRVVRRPVVIDVG